METHITADEHAKLAEPLQEEYQKGSDGAFVVKLTGKAPPGLVSAQDLADANGEVTEFRKTSTGILKDIAVLLGIDEGSVTKELTPLRAFIEKFKNVDLEKHTQLLSDAAKLKSKGITNAEDISEIIRTEIAAGLKDVNIKLETSETARVEAQGRADQATFSKEITDPFIKAGGKRRATDYIVTQAHESFHIVDGKTVAKDGKLSPKDGTTPITISEWMAVATKEHDFAFEGSGGGGSGTQEGSVTPAGAKELLNPTAAQLGDEKIGEQLSQGKLVIVNK